MKNLLALTLSLVFGTVAAAQEHKETSDPKPIPAGIQRYISDEGRYSVMFPSEPKLSSQDTTAPTGEVLAQHMAMAATADMLFMVGYFDYGANTVFSLDKARDGVVESAKGTLLEEHSLSLGGAPGRQIRLAGRTDAGLEFINRARFYDIKPRVFLLQCMVQKSQDSPAIAQKCEEFLDSFKVRIGGPG